MILEDLEMLVRGRDLSQGSELHHLERTVHQAGGEALETGAVVTVWGQEASLPTNPVIFLICFIVLSMNLSFFDNFTCNRSAQ